MSTLSNFRDVPGDHAFSPQSLQFSKHMKETQRKNPNNEKNQEGENDQIASAEVP